MRHLKFLALVVFAGLLLAGCASVAHVEKDDNANLNSYHNYAWVESSANQNDSVKTKVSDLTERKIREAVNAELAKPGWRESKTRPDVLINYDVVVEKGVKDDTNPVYSQPFTRYYYNPYTKRWSTIYYPSQFQGYQVYQEPVREGTITLTMMDAQSDKNIWQGWTTERLSESRLTESEIRRSVRNIFKESSNSSSP